MDRQATAVWKGKLKEGSGTLTTQSGAYDLPYTFKGRFEDESGRSGTNPGRADRGRPCRLLCHAALALPGRERHAGRPSLDAKAVVTLVPAGAPASPAAP